jgi:hypothetical protein
VVLGPWDVDVVDSVVWFPVDPIHRVQSRRYAYCYYYGGMEQIWEKERWDSKPFQTHHHHCHRDTMKRELTTSQRHFLDVMRV